MRKMYSQKQIERIALEIIENDDGFSDWLSDYLSDHEFYLGQICGDDLQGFVISDGYCTTIEPTEEDAGKVLGVNEDGEPALLSIPTAQTLSQFLESKFPANYQGVSCISGIGINVIVKQNGEYVIKNQPVNNPTIYAYRMTDDSIIPIHEYGDTEEVSHIQLLTNKLDEQNFLTSNEWKIPLESIGGEYT